MSRQSKPQYSGIQSGYDPRMLESCLLASPSHNPNAPGPRHTAGDDKDKADHIEKYLKSKGWR